MNAVSYHHLLQVATEFAGAQHYPYASLYLVPTPIGNLADITVRALHVLNIADALACEDTRHTSLLLNHYGIANKHLFALHQHNEQEATAHLIERLHQNQRIALVTDAGTPAISDPGARAVAAVRHAGFRIIPLPGASSITTAISAAGLDEHDVLFHGFLPAKAQERLLSLKELLNTPYAVVLLEAPHRIDSLCSQLCELAPERQITLARELTKQFEQVITVRASELPAWLAQKSDHKKGEFVCVVHAAEEQKHTAAPGYDEALAQALSYMPTKAATQLISSLTGVSKKTLYERALHLKNKA